MTRKDYPAISAVLKRVRDSYAPNWDGNLFRACDDHAHALAKQFFAENPKGFDPLRFLKDCGLPPDRIHIEKIHESESNSAESVPLMILRGTHHFVSFEAAVTYYKEYGFSREDVGSKRAQGEIVCGAAPQLKPGERLMLNEKEGRYYIKG